MDADNCTEKRTYSWDLVKPMSLDMDDRGARPHPRSAGLRVSAKSKAPSPPGLKTLESSDLSQWYPGDPHLTMDQNEKPIDQDLSLAVVLPDGVERMTTVHGSKPLMDLLVTLCAQYHLNPSSYTLELVTTNRKNTKLKPNALIGMLDVEKILLKPKGEDKNKKTGPQMPEATVRMVINYKKTQKTILRVSPRVPLADHLPAICEKCEFDVESTVLLRDVHSLSPLDLSCSLNDYAIREVYARDTKRQSASPVSPVSPSHAVFPSKDKTQKEEENKGLFSKFRKSRKKSEQETAASAPASPVLVSKPRPLSMALPSSNSCPLGDGPKKRRAPQPPMVVSQGCSDISPRRRINSEPNTRLELDQVAGLSCGSSAESSLKRTKRKAPLPPTTSSAAVQETVPVKESSQGGAAASALEEIMEQEETNVPLTSAAATDTLEEESHFSKSEELSLPSPSPETGIPSTISMESNGEDQPQQPSTDDKQLQSTEDESASPNGVRTEDAGASETADTTSTPCHLENGIQEAMSEESEGVKGDSSAPTCSLPPPMMQDAEVQYSFETNTEITCEQTDRTPVTSGTSCPGGEDAEVQIDVAPLPPPPQESVEEAPSLANIPAFESAEKKDMATSTEELDTPDLKDAASHAPETLSCQDPILGPADGAMAPCIYATNSEPKPKPSNELTRDYIPKVGMTTYTIVPQKSLEKLRYFEVALTLERPSATVEKGLDIDIGSLSVEDSTTLREQPEVSKEQSELQSTSCREDFLKSTTTATATTHDTVNGSIPESIQSSSSAVDGVQAGSPTEVKQVKIPPATKPKPASFRLTQHKKIPGYYVTSAAEKSLNSSSVSGLRGAPESARLPSPPRPPLLPGKSVDETSGAHTAELSPKEDKMAQITRQSSLPAKPLNAGLSLEKLRSFAAPRPFCPTTQSRFAQAVSSAVKRSQSLAHSPKSPCSPHSAPRSPNTSSPSVIGNKEFTAFKDNESTEMDGDKGCPLVVEGEGPVVMGGESPQQRLHSSDLL